MTRDLMIGIDPDPDDSTILDLGWATVTDRGLFIQSRNVKWEKFAEDFVAIQVLDNAMRWAIGDMYRAGVLLFRTKDPSQALSFAGVSLKTVQNWAWVCGRYWPTERVRGVSIHHHSVVAKLDQVTRRKWLLKVRDEDMTVEDLQEATAEIRGTEGRFLTPYDLLVDHYNTMLQTYVRLPDIPEKDRLRRALRNVQLALNEIEKRLATMKEARAA